MKTSAYLLGVIAAVASVHAAETNPPAAKTEASLPADDSYELRGFFGSGDSLEVSLATKGSKDSKWYAVGKKTAGILVEKADAKTGYAVLNRSGKRSSVRLASAAAPQETASDDASDEPVKTPSEKPDYASREYRHKRMKEMMEKASPAQMAEFQRVAQQKFLDLRKEHPDYFTKMDTPADRRRVGDAAMGIMMEAAAASAKLPDKEGQVHALPDDYSQLMRAEHEDNMKRWEEASAKKENAGDSEAKAETP